MMLIVSTYAWFTSQKDITLSNIRGTVEVAENMEISLDAKNWYQRIDLSNAATEFATAQASRNIALGENDAAVAKTTALAVVPSQLYPVSGVGEIRTKKSNFSGLVSSKTPRVNRVLNSGTATAPVGPRILSFS